MCLLQAAGALQAQRDLFGPLQLLGGPVGWRITAQFLGWSGQNYTKTTGLGLRTGCKGDRESDICSSPKLLCVAAGNKRPISGETGSAWAPHFLFVEFVPGKSEKEGQSGAV